MIEFTGTCIHCEHTNYDAKYKNRFSSATPSRDYICRKLEKQDKQDGRSDQPQ